MYNDFVKTLSLLLIALITYATAMAANWVNEKKKARTKSAKLRKLALAYNQDIEIDIILDQLVNEVHGAMRAYLARLHNGEEWIGGDEIGKKSRTHERVRDGISYQSALFRSILLSSIPEEVSLVEKQSPTYTEVSALPRGYFRYLCELGGSVAIARAAVRRNDRLIGLVGLDFDVKDGEPTNLCMLNEAAIKIGAILSYYKPE